MIALVTPSDEGIMRAMASFLGMDTDQTSQHVRVLVGRARDLDEISALIARSTAAVSWVGPDADHFRQDAAAVAQSLMAWSGSCRSVGSDLEQQVSQQEETSAADASTGAASAGPFGAGAGSMASAAVGSSMEGRALLSGVAAAPDGMRLGDQIGTYENLGDDIAPIDQDSVTHPDDATDPQNIDELLENLQKANAQQTDDSTTIRIQKVEGAPGTEPRYIVYVPGSHGAQSNLFGDDKNANPNDWNQNPGAYFGSETDSSQAVAAAMERAGIPHGADVAVVGHSQGGIVATNMAADPSINGAKDGWNFTDLLTVGSPVEQRGVPSSTSTTNLAHESYTPPLGNPTLADLYGGMPKPSAPDLVPTLDGDPHERGNLPENRVEIGVPSRSHNPLENHGIDTYRQNIAREQSGDGTRVGDQVTRAEEGPSLSRYLQDGRTTDTVDVKVSRKDGSYHR